MENRSCAVLRESANYLWCASERVSDESFTLCGRPQSAIVARSSLQSISRWLGTQADAIAALDGGLDNFMPEEFRSAWALAAQLPIAADSQLVASYLGGATLAQLQVLYGRPYYAVRKTLLAHEVELRPAHRRIPRSPRGMAKAYRAGADIRTLAKEHGLTYGMTRRMLICDGVPLRARGGS